MVRKIPEGDERERSCCSDASCGFISYQNPKIVVGAVCKWEGKVLLCQRAIPPMIGKWGYPQGYLEMDETTREGAARETLEEAGASFDPERAELLAMYNLGGKEVQILYEVDLANGSFSAGIESQSVQLFDWDEIPWDDLAFPTIGLALNHARCNVEKSPAIQQITKYLDEDNIWQMKIG